MDKHLFFILICVSTDSVSKVSSISSELRICQTSMCGSLRRFSLYFTHFIKISGVFFTFLYLIISSSIPPMFSFRCMCTETWSTFRLYSTLTDTVQVEELASLVKDNYPCKYLILSVEDLLVNYLQDDTR